MLRTYLAKLAEGAIPSNEAYWVPSIKLGARKGAISVLRPFTSPFLRTEENI